MKAQTIDALRLRPFPQLTSGVIRVMPKGEAVDVVMDCQASSGGMSWWIVTDTLGNKGWAASQWLGWTDTQPPPPPPPASKTLYAGIHVAGSGNAGQLIPALEKMVAGGYPPPMVLVCNDPGLVRSIKAVSKDILTVFRYVATDHDSGPFDNLAPNGSGHVGTGAGWFDVMWRQHEKAAQWADIHQMYNEPGFQFNMQGELYAERVGKFELEFMEYATKKGVKVSFGNYFPGTPEDKHWNMMRPTFAYAQDKGHWLCYHAYDSPKENDGFFTVNEKGEDTSEFFGLRPMKWLNANYPDVNVFSGETAHFESPRYRGEADFRKTLREVQRMGVMTNTSRRKWYFLLWTIKGQDDPRWAKDDFTPIINTVYPDEAKQIVTSIPTPVPEQPKWKLPFTAADRFVHASAGGWEPDERQLELVRNNRVKGVVIVAYEPNHQGAIALFRSAGVKHFIFRAATHDERQHVPDAATFVDRTLPRLKQFALALGGSQDMMIIPYNEPNAYREGYSYRWKNGVEFAEWFVAVAAAYRKELPGCRIGFPGMSPGGAISNTRGDEAKFIEGAKYAIERCDFVSVHYYWSSPTDAITPPVADWKRWYGNLPLIASEVGPGDDTVTTSEQVARAFAKFAEIGVACAGWLLHGAGGWPNADWTKIGIQA